MIDMHELVRLHRMDVGARSVSRTLSSSPNTSQWRARRRRFNGAAGLREAIQRADEAGRIADLPLTRIDIGEWTPAECTVGRVTAVDVAMSPVANLIVFGIPEFLSGDREYKFVAPHPGVFEGWIVGTHRNSFPQFGARPFRIECTAGR